MAVSILKGHVVNINILKLTEKGYILFRVINFFVTYTHFTPHHPNIYMYTGISLL